jgi:hypothetical protein
VGLSIDDDGDDDDDDDGGTGVWHIQTGFCLFDEV